MENRSDSGQVTDTGSSGPPLDRCSNCMPAGREELIAGTVGAVITAAGLSSRMKAFKPLLELGDSTILRTALGKYINAGCDPVILVTGKNSDIVQEHVKDLAVEYVFNPDYETCDMFSSVKLGLAAIQGRCSRVFIAPADIPLISTDTLKIMMVQPGEAVRPAYCGRTGHPVLVSAGLLPDILTFDGSGGLKGALEHIPVSDILVNDPGILLDADTPEDYERLKQYHQDP